MGAAQPEAVFDAVARLPYSIVVTALQGETRRTLSDAQHRGLEAPWLPVVCCFFFSFFFLRPLQQNKVEISLCRAHTDGIFSKISVKLCSYVLFYWLGVVCLITDLP